MSGLRDRRGRGGRGGGRPVLWLPGFDDAERVLAELLRDGDLCLVLGAGNVVELGRSLVTDPPA